MMWRFEGLDLLLYQVLVRQHFLLEDLQEKGVNKIDGD